MKHLSGMDNLFLAMETPDHPLHVASLSIYDPTTAPGGKVRFKAILKHFAGRAHQWTQFRRKLVSLPFGLDRPYWIDEPEFDLEYHVRHIALPQPGDWRQLMIQVARIHSRPLDMTKPLWEAYVIEGLDNVPGVPPGGFALYLKVHHSAIDGEAGAQLVQALHSLTSAPDAAEAVGNQTIVADRDPTAIELYARAVGNRTRQVVDASTLLFSVGSRLAAAGKKLLASGHALETGKDLVAKVVGVAVSHGGERSLGGIGGVKPHTRFDDPPSGHRVVDAVGLPLDDFARIRKKVDHVTVNDIFLATVGGGLRRYLESKGELPQKSVIAMVPMSTRGEAKDIEASNQLSMAAVPLASDIASPLERLRAVRRGSGKSKAMSNALGKDLPARLINILPVSVTRLLLTKGLMSLANLTVSNVRGPDIPLYLAGARLHSFLPVSAIISGLGLNVTGFSYNGTLWVCAVCSRRAMPDPAFFAQCLKESFGELVAAAALPEPRAASVAAARARPAKPATKAEVAPEAAAAAPRRRRAASPRQADVPQAPEALPATVEKLPPEQATVRTSREEFAAKESEGRVTA